MIGALTSFAGGVKVVLIALAVTAVAGVGYKVLHDAGQAGALRQAMETARDIAEANRAAAERSKAAHEATLEAQAEALDRVAKAHSERDAVLAAVEAERARVKASGQEVGPCPADCFLRPVPPS